MKQIVVNNFSTSYYITEDGRCYNSNTKKYLKGQYNYKNGYLSYNITLNDGSQKRVYAHRLIAEAYIPNENKSKTQSLASSWVLDLKTLTKWSNWLWSFSHLVSHPTGETIACIS